MPKTLYYRLTSDTAKAPFHATNDSSGLDLCCVKDFVIQAKSTMTIPTGVAFNFEDDDYGILFSKSSLANRGIFVQGGVIDNDYTGEVQVYLYNSSCNEMSFRPNQPIAQMLLFKNRKINLQQLNTRFPFPPAFQMEGFIERKGMKLGQATSAYLNLPPIICHPPTTVDSDAANVTETQ
jgi:dUTP pyrophosphatase